jgi:sugar transferase (PEP-CTERM/EpsH1 system associated)
MRILYIATRICWPVRSGAHLRDFHIAQYLASKAELTYLGLDSGEEGAQNQLVCFDPIPALGEAKVVRVQRGSGYSVGKIVRGLIGPSPLVILNYTSPTVTRELERLLSRNRFDVVQVEGIFMSAYVPLIRRFAPRALLNADWHNVDSGLMDRYAENELRWPHRLYARRTASLLRKLEDQFLSTCDSHTVCSELERQHLLSRNSQANIEVIPNGVDTKAFAATARTADHQRTLLFVGAMDYHANIDGVRYFANEVWPAIHQRRPELQFLIVGSKPSPEVRKLGERPGITVTGAVDDLRPYYADALAAVVPLRIGGGTRLKILEAMAAGTPVISTSIGAEGLPVRNGRDILLADSPQELAQAAALLNANSDLWKNLAAAGREFVVPFDWSVIGDKLLRFYDLQRSGLEAHSARQ